MAFLGKRNASRAKGENVKKSRITVGSLFNPNIGATLRPLSETGHMLVTLIAAIFAANGLFPRNHPALLNVPGAHISLSEVLSVGWQNVTFTREALPRTLIFFAVVLSLGFTTLAIFAALLHLFVGKAHAQFACINPVSCFIAPGDTGVAGTGTDIGINWLNWLFLNVSSADYLTGFTDPITGNPQTMPVGATDSGATSLISSVLVEALGLYSYCMLIIGAIVLFYHLAAMVTETAHHGVVMGRRANQVWAPIRLVTAVGLLVPIGAIGFGTELNSGQYIILQIAKWGIGLAGNVWGLFVNQLAADDFNFVPPNPPYARGAVTDTYLSNACIEAYNQLAFYVNGGATQIPPIVDRYGNPAFGVVIDNPDGSEKISYTPQGPDVVAADNDLCGYYVLPAPQLTGTGASDPIGATEATLVGNAQTAVYAGAGSAWGDMLLNAEVNGGIDAEYFIPPSAGGLGGGAPFVNDDLEDMITGYLGDLTAYYSGLSGGLAGAMASIAATTTQQGAFSAATWFGSIARIQGDITDIARDMSPHTAPPQVDTIVRENAASFPPKTLEYETRDIMASFNQWIYQGFGWQNWTGYVGATGTPDQQQVELAAAGTVQQGAVHYDHVMDEVFEVIDQVAALNGAWHTAVNNCQGASCFTLGVQFTTNNPIAEIAAFGHANINTAYQLYDEYIVLQGVASGGRNLKDIFSAFGQFAGIGLMSKLMGIAAHMGGDAAGALGNIIGGAVTVFFTAGFLLAFFLPLIPFYRFFFATLSWFLGLFEAMVAVPLIALAHLTPEGEGFMGEKAKASYYFVFNIFLKPVLMVFGLITGYLIFCLCVSAMNLLFMTAVSGAGGVSQGHFTLARLVYSIIYVVIIYLCCNKCFQLIDWLPDHAIKWMGAQGLHHAQMGDPSEVGNYMAGASGYMENKIVQSSGELMKGSAGTAILGGMAQSSMGGTLTRAAGNFGQQIGAMSGNPGAGQAATKALQGAISGSSEAFSAGSAGVNAISGLSKEGMAAYGAGVQAVVANNPNASLAERQVGGIEGVMGAAKAGAVSLGQGGMSKLSAALGPLKAQVQNEKGLPPASGGGGGSGGTGGAPVTPPSGGPKPEGSGSGGGAGATTVPTSAPAGGGAPAAPAAPAAAPSSGPGTSTQASNVSSLMGGGAMAGLTGGVTAPAAMGGGVFAAMDAETMPMPQMSPAGGDENG